MEAELELPEDIGPVEVSEALGSGHESKMAVLAMLLSAGCEVWQLFLVWFSSSIPQC